jgi:hypothetical protein
VAITSKTCFRQAISKCIRGAGWPPEAYVVRSVQEVRAREYEKKFARKDLWRFRVAAIGFVENRVGDHVVANRTRFQTRDMYCPARSGCHPVLGKPKVRYPR